MSTAAVLQQQVSPVKTQAREIEVAPPASTLSMFVGVVFIVVAVAVSEVTLALVTRFLTRVL
jgi:hypothetical protein